MKVETPARPIPRPLFTKLARICQRHHLDLEIYADKFTRELYVRVSDGAEGKSGIHALAQDLDGAGHVLIQELAAEGMR